MSTAFYDALSPEQQALFIVARLGFSSDPQPSMGNLMRALCSPAVPAVVADRVVAPYIALRKGPPEAHGVLLPAPRRFVDSRNNPNLPGYLPCQRDALSALSNRPLDEIRAIIADKPLLGLLLGCCGGLTVTPGDLRWAKRLAPLLSGVHKVRYSDVDERGNKVDLDDVASPAAADSAAFAKERRFLSELRAASPLWSTPEPLLPNVTSLDIENGFLFDDEEDDDDDDDDGEEDDEDDGVDQDEEYGDGTEGEGAMREGKLELPQRPFDAAPKITALSIHAPDMMPLVTSCYNVADIFSAETIDPPSPVFLRACAAHGGYDVPSPGSIIQLPRPHTLRLYFDSQNRCTGGSPQLWLFEEAATVSLESDGVGCPDLVPQEAALSAAQNLRELRFTMMPAASSLLLAAGSTVKRVRVTEPYDFTTYAPDLLSSLSVGTPPGKRLREDSKSEDETEGPRDTSQIIQQLRKRCVFTFKGPNASKNVAAWAAAGYRSEAVPT